MTNNWQDRISINPNVRHGKACIRGTRIPVSVILGNLAAIVSKEEAQRSYSSLASEDLDAAMAYAAGLARERFVPLPMETVS